MTSRLLLQQPAGGALKLARANRANRVCVVATAIPTVWPQCCVARCHDGVLQCRAMAEVLGRDRDRDNNVAGAKAGGAGVAPGKQTLAGELSGPVLPMLPGPPPAAYDDPATVAGPNK